MKIDCLYSTKKVDSLMRKNNQFNGEVNEAINKFFNDDWVILVLKINY